MMMMMMISNNKARLCQPCD